QEVIENTRYKSNPLSYVLNPEPSPARSPRQAGPTASPCSTNGPPHHRYRLTAGDDNIRLTSELDYSKEASAMVPYQHSGRPDHLLNDPPMVDPPETALSDGDDARSCTTLAGEEDRRSLTPAPVSGRPFRRAYKQEFEGKGARTRNTREQQDISELAATLETKDVDQDQGRGANAVFPASDWPQLQSNFSMELTAQGDGLP
ncbi:hypothetical protein NW759_017418, partial [Fusarium solani]